MQPQYPSPYGQPQHPQHGAPPPGLGMPPAQPGAMGMAPPPTTFQGWFTVYYQMMQPHEVLEAMTWFGAIDRDRSGHITASELQHCSFANVPLGFDTAAKMVRVFDKNYTGHIDIHEYCAMHKFLSMMQTAFFAGDRDRSGRLDAVEIHTALGVGQLTVALPAVQALYNKYNRDGYGCTFPDFLQLCAHVAQAKSVFMWENQAQGNRGTITLNWDRFVELTGRI